MYLKNQIKILIAVTFFLFNFHFSIVQIERLSHISTIRKDIDFTYINKI